MIIKTRLTLMDINCFFLYVYAVLDHIWLRAFNSSKLANVIKSLCIINHLEFWDDVWKVCLKLVLVF